MRRKSVTYNLYIDVLFFVNFIMDFLLLVILRKVLKYHGSYMRMVSAGSLGAVWAVFAAAFPLLPRAIEAIITYVLISALMVKTAYGLKGVREIARGVIGLYMTAVMMGGTIYALYQHTKAGYYVEQLIRGHVEEAMPLGIWFLLMAGGYFGIRFIWFWVIKARTEKNNLYQVTLRYRGKAKIITALMDTGNHLYEPVTHKPVHVVTYEALKNLCESVSTVIYIPFSSVGKRRGMMPGIFLDEMEVRQGEEVFTLMRPLVAVCLEPLSPSGEYQMLLHEE